MAALIMLIENNNEIASKPLSHILNTLVPEKIHSSKHQWQKNQSPLPLNKCQFQLQYQEKINTRIYQLLWKINCIHANT